MLRTVVSAGVPALVFFAMVVVGMDLTADDFRRVVRRRGMVVAATAGQLVLLPLIGWALVRSMDLRPAIAQGVLLVVACPAGTMANLYTHLARANAALSVTLTAISCLAGVLTMPLALSALRAGEDPNGYTVPVGTLAGQLVLLLVLPVLAGMGIRRRWPDLTRRCGRVLLCLNLTALAALLAFIVVQELDQFLSAFSEIAATAILLTLLAFAAGWLTAWASATGATDRFTVGMVFVVRNVGIATAVAVTALGRVEFAVFATAYFLAQVPILFAGAALFRWIGTAARDGAARPGERKPSQGNAEAPGGTGEGIRSGSERLHPGPGEGGRPADGRSMDERVHHGRSRHTAQ